MAKINLVRNIDPASAPLGGAHGILRDDFSAMRSASARERDAEDSLSRGLNHVGKVLLSIYDDMAAVRKRQEMLEGGNRLFRHTGGKQPKDFPDARFGGVRRRGGLGQVRRRRIHSARAAAADGIARAVERTDKRLARLWADSLEGTESAELREARFNDACRRIDSRRLSLLRERLRRAAGPEEAERIWNSGRAESADGYAAEMFDVFALSAAAEAEKRAEREAGKTGEKRRRDLDAAARWTGKAT